MKLTDTVKFGVSPRGEGGLPTELKEQLEERESKTQIGMTGQFHNH